MTTLTKMLNPALFGLVAVVGMASGCIIDNSSSCSASMEVSWDIEDTGGVPLSCDQVPADTVRVIMDGVSHPFACSAGGAVITGIPLGVHSAQLQLVDQGNVVSDTGAMGINFDKGCIHYNLTGGPPVIFTVN